jgi:type II secretory ATPase GspE/PulE/Tfp pilus assembly ATPase PilB-like protein
MSGMSDEAREQEERATRDQAALMKLPYCDTRVEGTVQLLGSVMDPASMAHYHAVPLRRDDSHFYVGITVKTPQSTMQQIRDHFQDILVNFEVISESSMREILSRYQPVEKTAMAEIQITDAGSSSLGEISVQLDAVRADDAFRFLMTQAIALGCSDIHIEPARSGVRVRFRIDGALHQVAVLTHEKHGLIDMELVRRAGIKRMLAMPQAGRFTQSYIDANSLPKQMSMRVETMPTLFGTETVIRLFNLDTSRLRIDQMELDPKRKQEIARVLARPFGLALVVGPTGSGKTTTLYTFINELNTPERKIVTLEDPIEYELDGITQVPVTVEDQSFGVKLEAVLREDPDVIMIGEIRNYDTARTALQAALTGHLVLTTFHAGSAASALTRLLDMIEHNPLLSSAVRLIIAQRLVRRLCTDCRLPGEPSERVRELISTELSKLPQDERPDLSNIRVYTAPGCDKCHHIGYRGRAAIREMLAITPELEELLARRGAELTTAEMEKIAVERGMRTLLQDALLKVVAGETSVDELSRTTDIR